MWQESCSIVPDSFFSCSLLAMASGPILTIVLWLTSKVRKSSWLCSYWCPKAYVSNGLKSAPDSQHCLLRWPWVTPDGHACGWASIPLSLVGLHPVFLFSMSTYGVSQYHHNFLRAIHWSNLVLSYTFYCFSLGDFTLSSLFHWHFVCVSVLCDASHCCILVSLCIRPCVSLILNKVILCFLSKTIFEVLELKIYCSKKCFGTKKPWLLFPRNVVWERMMTACNLSKRCIRKRLEPFYMNRCFLFKNHKFFWFYQIWSFI